MCRELCCRRELPQEMFINLLSQVMMKIGSFVQKLWPVQDRKNNDKTENRKKVRGYSWLKNAKVAEHPKYHQ